MIAVAVTNTAHRRDVAGPPLALPMSIAVVLFMASIVAAARLGSPFASVAERLDAVEAVRGWLTTAATLQFAASVPLAIFAATAHVRLSRLGARVPGSFIALTGGVLASAFLAVSAVALWALARTPTGTSPELALAMQDFAFAAGGPAHVAPLGLAVAGIAVPGLLLNLLPRPLALAGIAIAAVAELSTLTLVSAQAAVLLPLARFPALMWLLVVAFALPAIGGRRAGS